MAGQPLVKSNPPGRNMTRIVLDGHHLKGPFQVGSKSDGHPAQRRVPKSSKKVRAPALPPSATPKDQHSLPTEKVTHPQTAETFVVESLTNFDQPQRPARQKKQIGKGDTNSKDNAPPVSSSLTIESKNVICLPEAANEVNSVSSIPKARSSKKRPAPLPNQAPQILTVSAPVNAETSHLRTSEIAKISDVKSVPNAEIAKERSSVNAEIPQVGSGKRYSNPDCSEGPLKTAMPSKVSDGSQLNLSPKITGRARVGDSGSDSEAPPLPSTAPPPLPISPPPLSAVDNSNTALGQLDPAEEISIEYSVPISLSRSDLVSDTDNAPSISHQPSVESTMLGDSTDKTTESIQSTKGNIMEQHPFSPEQATVMNASKNDTKPGDDDSLDSDISTDDENNEKNKGGTYDFFSPGDSGRMSWSLTTSADGDITNPSNNDDGVILISNTLGGEDHNKATNSSAIQSNPITSTQKSPTNLAATSTFEDVNTLMNNTLTDSVITASTSNMTLSIPKHNKLDLCDENEPDGQDTFSTNELFFPEQKSLKTQASPTSTQKETPVAKKPPSPTQQLPPLKLTIQKSQSPTQKPVSPVQTKPPSPATHGNQDHQDLLASTAALIKSQKSATPRDIAPQKSKAPESPTRSSPVNEPVVKSGSLALFSPRRNEEQPINMKSTKEKELVAKAMLFADMTQPKAPIFVVKKAHKDEKAIESEESIDPILLKHKVKARTFEDDSLENGIHDNGRSYSSNPSEYGYIYSAEREQPPPEVGWKERPAPGGEHGSVCLYSENVLKEGDTTETVDRESIANLSTTKKQWETIFTSKASPSASSPEASGIKKKGQPKWEVRLPYKEKHQSPSLDNLVLSPSEASSDVSPTMSSLGPDTESAIEREIRLAHEREEMLKLEKAERECLKQEQQHHQTGTIGQGQSIIASYEASSAESESYHPAFDELTEADRGPDLWAQSRNRDRLEFQEDDKVVEVNPNESIIEREIRLQQERENEIASLRQLTTPRQAPLQKQVEAVQTVVQGEDVEDENLGSSRPPDGESLIAQELRQLQEREEEIRHIHGIHSTPQDSNNDQALSLPITSTPSLTVSANQQTPRPAQTGLSPSWQKDVSPFVSVSSSGLRRSSADSASSHSTSGRTPSDCTPSRNVRVQPFAMDGDEDGEKPNYFAKQETPIEREMRIARERENELRRQKGLPEIVVKEDDYYRSYSRSSDQSTGTSSGGNAGDTKNRVSSEDKSSNMTPRSSGMDPMKRFASNRLQQELMQQKEREMALRNEGKIISTSEEYIQPLKYTEVAGVDWVDGKEKRNFVINSSRRSSKVVSPQSETPSTPEERGASLNTSSGSAKKGGSVASGGQLFSYKEFRQTAESKIERELREMREREEELKMLRLSKEETPR